MNAEQDRSENQRENYQHALQWIQRHEREFFKISDAAGKHSLKAFIAQDKKIVWMEFRTNSCGANHAYPISLSEEPPKFQRLMDQEWKNVNSKANESCPYLNH